MTPIIKGNVIYKTSMDENTQGVIKTLAIWTIPNLMELYKEVGMGSNKEIRSPADSEKFEFGMLLNRLFKEYVNIYYKSKMKQLYLKSVELKSLIFNERDWNYEQEQSIALKENEMAPANKWMFLKQLNVESKGFCIEESNTKKILCLVENGSLRLSFELVIPNNEIKPDYFNIPSIRLKDLFNNMFLEGPFSDVVIKSSDGDVFKVHKVLLASQSSVLKASFEHNFTESATNIVESPLETAVLHEMLSFMYTDEAKVDDMPEKLLAAADYYQLNRLKSLCEKVLYKQLTIDNAIETLQLADLHSAGTLLQLTLEFINKNNEQLRLVIKTEGWANLKSIDLIKRIFE